MTIEQMHWEVLNKFDNVTSLTKRGLLPHEIDAALNDAILIWYYRTYNPERKENRAFELTQHQIDKLSNFVIKSPSVLESGLTKETNSVQANNLLIDEFQLSNTQKPYANLIRLSAKLENCTLPIEVVLTDHDDLSYTLTNEFTKPNTKWNRLVAVFGASSDDDNTSSIYVYRNSDQVIELLYPEYLRLPVEVSIGGYNDINNQSKSKVECDIAERFHNEIVDIAVTELKRILHPDTVAVYEDKIIK